MEEKKKGTEEILFLPSPSVTILKLEERKVGRPSIFSPELADKICHELALGKSMRTVCAPDSMPDMSTVFRWLRKDEEFCKQYARAKEESADAMAEEILDIADDGSNDFMLLVKGDNEYVVENKEWTNRSKLRVDTRKWIMSKLKPKKYADKLDVTSGGEVIKGNSINFNSFTLNATNGQ